MDIAYITAGAVVGLLVGLTGVGGGAVMTPLLVLGFGVSPSLAVGTDLLYAAITKGAGVMVHGVKGSVRWRIVALLAAGSLPGAVAAIAWLERFARAGGNIDTLITPLLAGMLVITAVVLLGGSLLQRRRGPVETGEFQIGRARAVATVAAGLAIGALVALSSIGAGALTAALLFLLYPRLPAAVVVGTDLAHAVPLALVAGLGHLHLGTVDFTLLGALLLGSIPGIVIGSHLGLRLPDRILRPLLAGMLLLIGLRFAF